MPAIDTDVKVVQRMFDVNLFGPMRMVRNFHDMLIESKGTIVNISSIGGIIPFLYGCESKAPASLFQYYQFTDIQSISIVQCQQGGSCSLGEYAAGRVGPV